MARGPIDKPRLRKREIALALGAGLLAAGGAAIALEDGIELDVIGAGDRPEFIAQGETDITYDVAEFHELFTAGPQDVVITYGEEFSVRSEGSAGALALLQVAVQNGRLTIGPEEGFNWNRWGQLQNATFFVTVPGLDNLSLAGSGDVTIDRIEGESFTGTITGQGATMTIGDLVVDEADLSIAGQGDIRASGTARETRIVIGGSGDFQGGGLRTEDASIMIGGNGDVALAVSEEAQIAIGGRGDVEITGTDNCSLARVGNGDVRCNGVQVRAN